MHRAFNIARASHVNGYNAYIPNTLLHYGKIPIRRGFAISLRQKVLYPMNTSVKHAFRHFPHGPGLILPRSVRHVSWSWKSHSRVFAAVPDNEEDAARAAILDKVMKGRQPADLMLRCKQSRLYDILLTDLSNQVQFSTLKVRVGVAD